MKWYDSIFVGWQSAVLAFVVIVIALPGLAYCQTDGTALLLQQTPPQGGTISPSAGVHNFAPHTEVVLTAVPKPGYQFVYWLGDVSDPTTNSTTAYLDVPKIIIAVFQRLEYEFEIYEEMATSVPYGGLRGSAGDYARGGGGGGGGRRRPKWRWPTPPEQPEPPDFPTPEEGNDFPVPVPEPATGVLLVLGGLFALTGRRTIRDF